MGDHDAGGTLCDRDQVNALGVLPPLLPECVFILCRCVLCSFIFTFSKKIVFASRVSMIVTIFENDFCKEKK